MGNKRLSIQLTTDTTRAPKTADQKKSVTSKGTFSCSAAQPVNHSINALTMNVNKPNVTMNRGSVRICTTGLMKVLTKAKISAITSRVRTLSEVESAEVTFTPPTISVATHRASPLTTMRMMKEITGAERIWCVDMTPSNDSFNSVVSNDAPRVRLRAALDGLPSYRPGRPAGEKPGAPRQFKISSNENPYPPLPGVQEAVREAAEGLNRYPDMFAAELVAAIADRFDVPVEHVATGTGSVGVLQQIIQACAAAGDEVVYAWRSFEAYPIVVGISGATSVRVPLTVDAQHDLEAMSSAVTDRTRLVLVCSPNNPTGPAVGREELAAFLDRVPKDVLVVMDEAYREFVRDPNAADGLEFYRDHHNVCVLRTFSKAYGLAGMRVGFAISHDEVADALRKTAVPFGVSGLAQAAAVASLRREPELLERVDALVAERERVAAALREQGWRVPHTEANFVWMELGADTDAFAQKCTEAGVIVRPFSGEGCRVTVAEREANDIFLDVTADWVAANGAVNNSK